MYNLFICDDDEKTLWYLSSKLEEYKIFNIKCFNSCKNLISELKKTNVDILMIDIELNDKMNGIDVVKYINSKNIEIIYISGYSKYCTDVYETKHSYFLLKPFKTMEIKNYPFKG